MDINRFDIPGLALMLGIQEGEVPEKVPEQVLNQYFRARRLMSRVGAGGPLPPAALVIVGLCSGLGYETGQDKQEVTFEDRVRLGDVKENDRIEVEWRGKPVEVTFEKITSGRRVLFRFDDKKSSCTVAMDKARPLDLVGA